MALALETELKSNNKERAIGHPTEQRGLRLIESLACGQYLVLIELTLGPQAVDFFFSIKFFPLPLHPPPQEFSGSGPFYSALQDSPR